MENLILFYALFSGINRSSTEISCSSLSDVNCLSNKRKIWRIKGCRTQSCSQFNYKWSTPFNPIHFEWFYFLFRCSARFRWHEWCQRNSYKYVPIMEWFECLVWIFRATCIYLSRCNSTFLRSRSVGENQGENFLIELILNSIRIFSFYPICENFFCYAKKIIFIQIIKTYHLKKWYLSILLFDSNVELTNENIDYSEL